MKIPRKYIGTIQYVAYVRHCNGGETSKELTMDVVMEHNDPDGTFEAPVHFAIPVPYDVPCEDYLDELEGNKITITIED